MLRARSQIYPSGRRLVAVIAALCILVGCAGSATDHALPRASSGGTAKPGVSTPVGEALAPAPKIGDCWNTTPRLLGGVSWEGEAAVACSQKHNAVTYQTGILPTGLSYATIESDGLTKTELVTDICNNEAANTYLGHGNFRPPLRLDDVFFAPTGDQWAAGARWFRCDLGFPDITSDSSKQLEWQPLPADLLAATDRDDRPFTICSSASLKRGPHGPHATLGKCGPGMHWLLTSFLDIAKTPGEPYPTNKVVRHRAWAACDSPLRRWAIWPTRVAWEDRETRAKCWVEWDGG